MGGKLDAEITATLDLDIVTGTKAHSNFVSGDACEVMGSILHAD